MINVYSIIFTLIQCFCSDFRCKRLSSPTISRELKLKIKNNKSFFKLCNDNIIFNTLQLYYMKIKHTIVQCIPIESWICESWICEFVCSFVSLKLRTYIPVSNYFFAPSAGRTQWVKMVSGAFKNKNEAQASGRATVFWGRLSVSLMAKFEYWPQSKEKSHARLLFTVLLGTLARFLKVSS